MLIRTMSQQVFTGSLNDLAHESWDMLGGDFDG